MKARLYWGLYCSIKRPKREPGTHLWALGSLNEVTRGRRMDRAEGASAGPPHPPRPRALWAAHAQSSAFAQGW